MTSTTPIARKRHVCDHCCHAIDKGERYCRQSFLPGEYDYDTFGTFKCHRFCADLTSRYHREHDLCSDEGVDFEEALHELWEQWGVKGYLAACQDVDTYRQGWARVQAGETGYTETQVRAFERRSQDVYPAFFFDDEVDA